MKMLKFVVSENEKNSKIETILKNKLYFSNSLLKVLKEHDSIFLNEDQCFMGTRVDTDDVITVDISDKNYENPYNSMNCNIEIVFENDYFLVIDKPKNLPVFPKNKDGSVAEFIAFYLGKNIPFHPVNRLDKGTSGLMIIAKCSYYHTLLKNLLHTDYFVRKYMCVIEGKMENPCGVIEKPILRDDTSFIKRKVGREGKPAITQYETVKTNSEYSMISVKLITGRTHQIRVHFASEDHPLVGDWLYGKESPGLIDRPVLHSYSIDLFDPVENRRYFFESPLPDDMKKLLI